MKHPNLSAKRMAIDKKNASMLAIVSVAVFVVIFSIVAIRSLYSQLVYQSRVINKKEITLKQIELNIEEVSQLNIAYQEFASQNENIIGGDSKGNGDRDGENARIILDALPSEYDFPALTTSVNKLVKTGGFNLVAIEGTDDEANQIENGSSEEPEPIEIPFSLEAVVSQNDGEKFLRLFERSIRPIKVRSLEISGKEGQLDIVVSAMTYYQPSKKLNVTEETVK